MALTRRNGILGNVTNHNILRDLTNQANNNMQAPTEPIAQAQAEWDPMAQGYIAPEVLERARATQGGGQTAIGWGRPDTMVATDRVNIRAPEPAQAYDPRDLLMGKILSSMGRLLYKKGIISAGDYQLLSDIEGRDLDTVAAMIIQIAEAPSE